MTTALQAVALGLGRLRLKSSPTAVNLKVFAAVGFNVLHDFTRRQIRWTQQKHMNMIG